VFFSRSRPFTPNQFCESFEQRLSGLNVSEEKELDTEEWMLIHEDGSRQSGITALALKGHASSIIKWQEVIIPLEMRRTV